jgi:hypothetical protein
MTRRTPLPAAAVGCGMTTQEARLLGVSRSRLRASDLSSPRRGTWMEAAREATLADHLGALSKVLPAHAFFCGTTAAELHGIPLPPEASFPRRAIEVGVPSDRRAVRREEVIGRKLAVPAEELVLIHGRAVTSPERTWCDLAGELTLPQLVAAGDWMLHVGLTTREALVRAVERHPGRRHRGRLLRALPLLDGRAESPKESELRVILVLAGMPEAVPQVVIRSADGRFIARVDLLIEEYGEVLEYQGDHHRTDKAQWRRDRAREAELEAEGLHVTEVTADDLATPTLLIDRLSRTLHRKGWRPAPARGRSRTV